MARPVHLGLVRRHCPQPRHRRRSHRAVPRRGRTVHRDSAGRPRGQAAADRRRCLDDSPHLRRPVPGGSAARWRSPLRGLGRAGRGLEHRGRHPNADRLGRRGGRRHRDLGRCPPDPGRRLRTLGRRTSPGLSERQLAVRRRTLRSPGQSARQLRIVALQRQPRQLGVAALGRLRMAAVHIRSLVLDLNRLDLDLVRTVGMAALPLRQLEPRRLPRLGVVVGAGVGAGLGQLDVVAGLRGVVPQWLLRLVVLEPRRRPSPLSAWWWSRWPAAAPRRRRSAAIGVFPAGPCDSARPGRSEPFRPRPARPGSSRSGRPSRLERGADP